MRSPLSYAQFHVLLRAKTVSPAKHESGPSEFFCPFSIPYDIGLLFGQHLLDDAGYLLYHRSIDFGPLDYNSKAVKCEKPARSFSLSIQSLEIGFFPLVPPHALTTVGAKKRLWGVWHFHRDLS